MDILANLLAPPKSLRGVDNQPVGPIIEVLSTSVNEETGTDDDLIQAAETLSFEEKEILKGLLIFMSKKGYFLNTIDISSC